MLKSIVFILVLFCVGAGPVFDPPRAFSGAGGLIMRLSSPEVANGHTLLLEITLPDSTVPVRHVYARQSDRSLRVFAHPARPRLGRFALIGIPYLAEPGADTVLVGWTENDLAYTRTLSFRVVHGPYKSEQIRGVPQSRVTPSPADLRRIEREKAEIAAAYETVRDSLMMAGSFQSPVEQETVTSEYGTRRVFNGQLRSYHGGVDLRAYEGTPIYAAQAGLVRLAKNLFYNGNHVILEHGMGVFSSYSHMSRLFVEPGDEVEKGQLLGLSGATGRVTAAHLHWSVRVNGVGVSPMQFAAVLGSLYRDGEIVENAGEGRTKPDGM